MANVGTMRAWFSGASQYIYWTVTQITDPLSEYPPTDDSGGGRIYPLIDNLSDFQLVNYNNPNRYSTDGGDFILDIIWGVNVIGAGYMVGITYNSMPSLSKLKNAGSNIAKAELSYSVAGPTYTTYAQGVSASTNKIIFGGSYNVYCDTVAYPGDNMYISPDNPGMVSNTGPYGAYYQIPVGVALAHKSTPTVATVNMLIQFGAIIPPSE